MSKGVTWLTIDSNAPGSKANLSADAASKVMTGWKRGRPPSSIPKEKPDALTSKEYAEYGRD